MKHSIDPVWPQWIKLFHYYAFSNDNKEKKDRHLHGVTLKGNELQKKCAILALSVAKWHPLNEFRGNGICFCCEFFDCKEKQTCPAMDVCGPFKAVEKRLYHKWYVARDAKTNERICDEIYEILLKQYRKTLKEMQQPIKQTKQICERHLCRKITHDDVLAIPEGIALLLEPAIEDPNDVDSDGVLRCTYFDEKGKEHKLGDFGGVENIFRLDAVPECHRMALYTAIAKVAEKIGAA